MQAYPESARKSYAKPPITEAVIDFRFDSQFTDEQIEKLRQSFSKIFDEEQEISQFQVKYDFAKMNASLSKKVIDGYKLNKKAMDDIFIISRQSITTSRLAPYPGWEEFLRTSQENWQRARETIGYKTISRIGIRYINRIDIPRIEGAEFINLEDYFNFYLNTPNIPMKLVSFSGIGDFESVSGDFKMKIITSPIQGPSTIFFSFLLDIDLYLDHDVPQRDDKVVEQLTRMRALKNEVFESCITNLTRKLFL